ncbi:MAG: TIGR00159 family protein [Lachnospiraceae bacterium]|nr:TIGR00159 family protein [Lachnospiraceae bacterium]
MSKIFKTGSVLKGSVTLETLWNGIQTIEIIDIMQIFLLAYFVYYLIFWIKNTPVLKGMLFIIFFCVSANFLHMDIIVWLMSKMSVLAMNAIIVVFQPELRKVLEQMSHKNPLTLLTINKVNNMSFLDQTINALVRASFEMGEVKTGALIVVEREVKLEEYEKTGIPIDALLTEELLINIFEHNTPLHDGAVIIRNNRVMAATCYLPLSDNMKLNKKLGTRHRAGLGISEVSDSLTIIVSEETGTVSYAMEGKLHIAVPPKELIEQLYKIQKRYQIAYISGRRKGKK